MRRLIAWLTVNDVTTGSSDAYPEVQPLNLEALADEAYDVVLVTARQMAGWRVVAEAPHDLCLRVEATTPLLRVVDDVRIWIEARGADGSWVQMHSRSRIGRGDFGTNARRIQAFLRLVGRSEHGE